MIDRAGEQLGTYQLVRLLGRGGFAEVYLGKHIYDNTAVAIKVLQARLTNEDMEKFQNEVYVIGRLKHPHIVRLRDFDIQNGFPFLVMDYAPNGTLRQRHQEGSQLPLPTIVTYLTQIAAALQYAHEQHVIHRDVKPQNLLIGFNDEILLSDFGLAVMSQSTSSPHIQNQAGTLLYMAPEQFDGHVLYASDQYAMGVIVYEWLCGRRPFLGTSTEISMQHQFAPPPPLQGNVPYVAPLIEQVVFKALAKDPKQRFHTIQDFALAFEQASRMTEQPHAILPMRPTSPLISIDRAPDPLFNSGLSSSPPKPIKSSQLLQPQSSGIHPVSPSAAPRYRKSLSKMQAAMLIGLLLIIVIASSGIFYLKVLKHTSATLSPLFLASVRATSSAHAYATISNSIMFGFDAAHTRVNPYETVLNPTNVFRLVPYWSASTGNPFFSGSSSPAVVNGIVYIGAGDHALHAFNASTGKAIWSAPTGATISSSPAVVNGIVYVGSEDHKLYAFNASTGKVLWLASTGAAIDSSPTVVRGVVYIGSDDYKLYAFNATTGKPIWSASTGSSIESSPAVVNGIVYIGSDDYKLYAFNATTGKPIWSASTDSTITSSPAVANGIVYVGSRDRKLYAFNATTGKPVWSTPTQGPITSSPGVANNIVYIASGAPYANRGTVYAFNATTGKNLWSTSVGGYVYSSPIIANNVVYIGSNRSYMYAFDAQTGNHLWIAPAGTPLSSPAVVNGVVYIGSDDNHLYAFHLSSP